MGCDIHVCVEVKVEPHRWEYVYKPEIDDGYSHNYYAPINRNYESFSVLAGVRNRHGIKPIARPRAVPEDCSSLTLRVHEGWEGDAHTPSWLSLQDLQGYHWETQIDMGAVISAETFIVWDKVSSPYPRSMGVYGANVVVVDAAEFEQLQKRDQFLPDKNYYIGVEWKETLSTACPELIKMMKRLGELDPDPTKVRIVFWFDN